MKRSARLIWGCAAAMTSALVVLPAVAEEATCPAEAITGEKSASGKLDDKGRPALLKALFRDPSAFATVYLKGYDEQVGPEGEKISPEQADACVTAALATTAGGKVYQEELRKVARSFASSAAIRALELVGVEPAAQPLEALRSGCGSLSESGASSLSIKGRYVGMLYADFAQRTFSTGADPSWPERPRSPHLWPAAAVRDAIVETFTVIPKFRALLALPEAPDEIRVDSPPPDPKVAAQLGLKVEDLPVPEPRMLAVPPVHSQLYRKYLAWIDPSAWPGPGTGSNPVLGAALTCMKESDILYELSQASL